MGWFDDLFFIGDTGDDERTRAIIAGEDVPEDERLQTPEGRARLMRERRIETVQTDIALDSSTAAVTAAAAGGFRDEIRERSKLFIDTLADVGEDIRTGTGAVSWIGPAAIVGVVIIGGILIFRPGR